MMGTTGSRDATVLSSAAPGKRGLAARRACRRWRRDRFRLPVLTLFGVGVAPIERRRLLRGVSGIAGADAQSGIGFAIDGLRSVAPCLKSRRGWKLGRRVV